MAFEWKRAGSGKGWILNQGENRSWLLCDSCCVEAWVSVICIAYLRNASIHKEKYKNAAKIQSCIRRNVSP